MAVDSKSYPGDIGLIDMVKPAELCHWAIETAICGTTVIAGGEHWARRNIIAPQSDTVTNSQRRLDQNTAEINLDVV